MNEINKYTDITITNVSITFKPADQRGRQEGIVFELPEDAHSDMIQTYLDQCIVPYLPFGNKSTYDTDLIGQNTNNIINIQLTFDSIESDPNNFHLNNRSVKPIKFDPMFKAEYKQSCKPIMLKHLEFIVSFSQFTLLNIEQNDVYSSRAIKKLINDQFMTFIKTVKNPMLNLDIKSIEYDDVHSIDEGHSDSYQIPGSCLCPLQGGSCDEVSLTHQIEIKNDAQYCFIQRDTRKRYIDLYFYSKEGLAKKQESICFDFKINRNNLDEILKLGPRETVHFKSGNVVVLRFK